MYVRMYVYMYVCICMCVFMYVCVCVCVCMYVCLYVCTYVQRLHPEPSNSTLNSSVHCFYKQHFLHSKATSILDTHVFTS